MPTLWVCPNVRTKGKATASNCRPWIAWAETKVLPARREPKLAGRQTMARNIRYWEYRRAVAEGLIAKHSEKLRGVRLLPVPKRSRLPSSAEPGAGRVRVFTHHLRWHHRYSQWKRERAHIRWLYHEVAKLRKRVAYHDERITALKKKTAWDHILV
jgi:hypothetical protein